MAEGQAAAGEMVSEGQEIFDPVHSQGFWTQQLKTVAWSPSKKTDSEEPPALQLEGMGGTLGISFLFPRRMELFFFRQLIGRLKLHFVALRASFV